jgi:hypothetical protein
MFQLRKRVRAIHDWPIDEATVARVVTIVTSVIAIHHRTADSRPVGL